MKLYEKAFKKIAKLGFNSAVNSVNAASSHGMHQTKEPKALLKYKSVK